MAVQAAPIQETIKCNLRYLRAKRALDIALTMLLLPLFGIAMLIIAVLVLLDSPGPIFFRQKRIGQDGIEFDFLKFRSMYVDNNDCSHRTAIQQFMSGQSINTNATTINPYKLVGDPRITRIGKIIRKTSLDELPQFFNVLRGEMSLVGPRPPLPY